MDEKRDLNELDHELGDWLRGEQKIAAPTRLVEGVFARTTATQQVRKPLLRWRRTDDKPGRRPTALFAVAALLLIGVVGAGTAGSLLTRSPRAALVATPSPSPSPSLAAPNLVELRTYRACHGSPEVVLIRNAGGEATSAWLTCQSDSVEVDLTTGTVADRPGFGLVATDESEQWALKGDSVVKLADDRSIVATERIGSPTALGVSGSQVFVLDAATGTVSAHDKDGRRWSVSPVPGGRLVGLTVVNGSPWVLLQNPGTLFRLDPENGDIQTTVAVDADTSKLGVAAGALYVTNSRNKQITRVDPATSAKTTFTPDLPLMGGIDALGGSPDGLLLSSQVNVLRLDPLTGQRLGDVVAGRNYITSLALDGDRMFLGTEQELMIEALSP